MPRPYLSRLFLFGLVLVAACMTGPRPPEVVPNQTLGPEALDRGTRPSDQPFAVVAGSPRGETESPSEISLVFNRPMRALELAGEEAAPPVTMTPSVPGRWQWVGTSALQFIPQGTLPYATEFRITVPKGTASLDGSTLAEDYELAFSTPRPEPVSAEPPTYEHLTPTSTFTVRFNQPIADAEIQRSFRILAGARKDTVIPFDVRRPERDNSKLALLVPKRRLPLDTDIVLRASADLRGTEGTLTAGKVREIAYRTYGPLVLAGVSCDKDTPSGYCAARHGIALRLNNRVKLGDVREAITIDPPVTLRFDEFEDDESLTDFVYFRGSFRPNTSYELRVSRELPGGGVLTDEYGQALARDTTTRLRTDDLWPEVEIGMSGSYLEAGVARDIPILAVNTSYELAVAKLDPDAIVRLEESRHDHGSAIARLQAVTSAKPRTIPAGRIRNQPTRELVRPFEVLDGKDRRGALAIAHSHVYRPGTAGQHVVSDLRVVQVTDLGISAKLSRDGSLVWVTKLSTGEPVRGAEVEIRTWNGSTVGPFVTDHEGIANVPATSFEPTLGPSDALVFVRKDGDWAYRRLADDLSPYAFGAERAYENVEPAIGLIFTDRGIYRPGDVVKVKGIVRQPEPRALMTPAGKKVRVTVTGIEGDEIVTDEVTLSEFGTFALDLTVPRTGRLGTYQIQANIEGSHRHWGDIFGSFDVAEYRPAELQVSVKADRESFVRGDSARFFGQASYLFGEPVSEASAYYRVSRAPAEYEVPGLPSGFVITDDAFRADITEMAPDTYLLQSGQVRLDAQGQVELSQKLSLPGQLGPERVRYELEVQSLSQQFVTGQKAVLVHPGEIYLALRKPQAGFVDAKKPLRVEALAVRPEGARERTRVRIDLIKRSFRLARQTGESSVHNVVQRVDETVGGCDLTTGAEPVACELVPPSAGYYLLRAKGKDARGNEIAASIGAYVFGEGASGFGDNDSLRLELVADSESYEVGQTARILVKSPFQTADALVTVERSGIYSQKRMRLEGPMPVIEVPITDELRPNAYVSVLLVRGRSKEKPDDPKQPDLGAPTFRLGYANLVVDPESRRLKVKVTPSKKELGPGDTVEVSLEVSNEKGQGEQAEVTLYAVDEAVLSLIGYKTPDPLPIFNEPRPLRTLTLESRESLARIFTAESAVLGLEKGDEGGGGAEAARRDFRQTVHFEPSLVTDANGRAKTSFKLPDSLTSYRIMAVAVGKTDRFGFGEERITSKKALMARPSMPRFLRAGDRFEAGVLVSAAEAGRVEIEAAAEGIELVSPSRTSVDLEPNRSQLVRFTFKAKQAGDARFTFRVKGRGGSDAVEIRRHVTVPAVVESVALYGDTTTASGEALGDLSSLRGDVGGLDVSLASTALVGLDTSIAELVEYPFTCTEQQVSRLVPLVTLQELARDFGFTPPKGGEELVSATVASILSAQRYDGGFGFWPSSPTSDPFVTTYALWGLGEAKRHGVPIPPRAIEDATRYVRRQLEEWQKTEIGPALAAFIVDVLAMNGSPDPGWESRIFEARDKMPVFGRALLAHAMATSKGHPEALRELSRELSNHVRLDGPVASVTTNEGNAYAVLLDSDTRTTALVLRALLAINPDEPLASRLAQGLLASRQGGSFRTTQEAAWALLALGDYRRAQEKTSPDFDARVFLGDSLLFSAGFHGRDARAQSASVPASRLVSAGGSVLAFAVEGQGALFYQARLRYARKELPRELLDRGFFVRQSLRAVTPDELSAAARSVSETSAHSFQAGDLVLADVVVVTPSPRDQVVVEAPIPAGFEPIDARLATTASYLAAEDAAPYDNDASQDDIAMGRAYRPSWVRQEVRDDRVLFFVEHMGAGMYRYRYLARATTPGSYVVPPLQASEMYAPEVFGRSGASTIEVRE